MAHWGVWCNLKLCAVMWVNIFFFSKVDNIISFCTNFCLLRMRELFSIYSSLLCIHAFDKYMLWVWKCQREAVFKYCVFYSYWIRMKNKKYTTTTEKKKAKRMRSVIYTMSIHIFVVTTLTMLCFICFYVYMRL